MTARPTDPLPALRRVAAALAAPGQPRPLFAAIERAAGELIGHRLFTLMVLHPEDGTAERIFSTDERSYPVGGRKALAATPWGARVLTGRRPYVGRGPADIRWAFADHELIASLGLGSVLNVPVVHDGACLGTMNLLHEAGWYADADAEIGGLLAALLIPALRARR